VSFLRHINSNIIISTPGLPTLRSIHHAICQDRIHSLPRPTTMSQCHLWCARIFQAFVPHRIMFSILFSFQRAENHAEQPLPEPLITLAPPAAQLVARNPVATQHSLSLHLNSLSQPPIKPLFLQVEPPPYTALVSTAMQQGLVFPPTIFGRYEPQAEHSNPSPREQSPINHPPAQRLRLPGSPAHLPVLHPTRMPARYSRTSNLGL